MKSKWLRSIIYLGVEEAATVRDNLKTRSLNAIALFTTLFNMGYIAFNAWHEQYWAVVVNMQFALTGVLIFYFNYRHQRLFSFLTTSIGYPLTFMAAASCHWIGLQLRIFFYGDGRSDPFIV